MFITTFKFENIKSNRKNKFDRVCVPQYVRMIGYEEPYVCFCWLFLLFLKVKIKKKNFPHFFSAANAENEIFIHQSLRIWKKLVSKSQIWII